MEDKDIYLYIFSFFETLRRNNASSRDDVISSGMAEERGKTLT